MTERQRLRAVRFGRFMDRIDGDWKVPATVERVTRFVYVRVLGVLAR